MAKEPGAFSKWGEYDSNIMDVEDFASAFVRFNNGAVLILEVSWMLHHETDMEDMQIWLYGKNGGLHWPKCEKISSDNTNKTHLKTRRENVKQWLKNNGSNITPEGSEAESEWSLLDLGDTIVHLMTPTARDYWDIDGLVQDCSIIYES